MSRLKKPLQIDSALFGMACVETLNAFNALTQASYFALLAKAYGVIEPIDMQQDALNALMKSMDKILKKAAHAEKKAREQTQ